MKFYIAYLLFYNKLYYTLIHRDFSRWVLFLACVLLFHGETKQTGTGSKIGGSGRNLGRASQANNAGVGGALAGL